MADASGSLRWRQGDAQQLDNNPLPWISPLEMELIETGQEFWLKVKK
jgi:hypothetical protein